MPIWAFAAAAALAILPALGVWPKLDEGGLVLAEPLFDHSKIAIVDDIARLGLPPGNPFFGEAGALAYYYLWHFSAAVVAALVGANGWEADIALTWFTGFASLALMMGLAVQLGGQRLAAPLVVLLSLAASLWPLLRLLFPADFIDGALSQSPWPRSWIFQASWVPQHLASASCVVFAVLILSRLGERRSWPLVPLLAVVVAAGFESSAWVGGVVFAAAALPFGVVLLRTADDARQRAVLLAQAAVAAALALALSLSVSARRVRCDGREAAGCGDCSAPVRGAGPPRARHRSPYRRFAGILGDPARHRVSRDLFRWDMGDGPARSPTDRLLRHNGGWLSDLPYWPARALASPGSSPARSPTTTSLGGASYPGILVLTIFAAAGIARWMATARARAAAALLCLALGIPGGIGIARENAVGIAHAVGRGLGRDPRDVGGSPASCRASMSGSATTRCFSTTACAGRSIFPGHSLPIAAPAMPGGTSRAPS